MERDAQTLELEPTLHAALQEAAQRHHVSLNSLVTMYCVQGLARENEPRQEDDAVSPLRTLLDEFVEQRVERQLDAMSDRLAKLTLRAIRHAAFAHRFLYHSIARTDVERADAIEAKAAQDTSWLLVTNLDDESPH